MAAVVLSLKGIRKSFGKQTILNGISIDVEHGEFVTLLGPSGCGKTTALRIIAGLEAAESGQVFIDGGDATTLAPERRNVNTVFQNYALFPHMNVYDNIGYGPRIRGASKAEIKDRVGEMLTLVKMQGYERRMPTQLSGGQRQRIAIARALVNKPALVLLDEPLGALDLKLRRHMQTELKQIQKQTGVTFIYVTHDQEEALNMSDRLAIMQNGAFEQIGTPEAIYNAPETKFVAGFVGTRNLLAVTGAANGAAVYNGQAVAAARRFSEGEKADIAIHADKMRLSRTRGAETDLEGVVLDAAYGGSQVKTHISVGEATLTAIEYNVQAGFRAGDAAFLSWDEADGYVIRAKTEVCL